MSLFSRTFSHNKMQLLITIDAFIPRSSDSFSRMIAQDCTTLTKRLKKIFQTLLECFSMKNNEEHLVFDNFETTLIKLNLNKFP